MKKRILILFVLCFIFTSVAMAAKYKVNTGGTVTNSAGKVQTSTSVPGNVSQQYNTYSANTYTANKIVLTSQVAMIDIVMDYSGSMSNWITAAQQAMSTIVYQIPQTTKIGFRVFGHNGGSNPYTAVVEKAQRVIKGADGKYRAVVGGATSANGYLGQTTGSCSATSQIVPISAYNANTLLTGMYAAKTGGATPLTYALYQSVHTDFASVPTNNSKKIILITDGGENCGGDPCAFARDLVKTRRDIVIDVVLVGSYSNNFKCLADATGGRFYNANDNFNFSNAIYNSIQQTSQPATQQTPHQQPEPTQNYEYIDY